MSWLQPIQQESWSWSLLLQGIEWKGEIGYLISTFWWLIQRCFFKGTSLNGGSYQVLSVNWCSEPWFGFPCVEIKVLHCSSFCPELLVAITVLDQCWSYSWAALSHQHVVLTGFLPSLVSGPCHFGGVWLRVADPFVGLWLFSWLDNVWRDWWSDTNLVDPASSHMLVSKIKPCMSQYKPLYGETANGSLKQL